MNDLPVCDYCGHHSSCHSDLIREWMKGGKPSASLRCDELGCVPIAGRDGCLIYTHIIYGTIKVPK